MRQAIAAFALTVGLAAAAQAHAHLLVSLPAADASSAPTPKELRLAFSEAVELGFTGLTLSTADGAVMPTGTPTLAPGDDRTLLVPVPLKLGLGSYLVDWHALAVDGHRTQGRYTFTVAP